MLAERGWKSGYCTVEYRGLRDGGYAIELTPVSLTVAIAWRYSGATSRQLAAKEAQRLQKRFKSRVDNYPGKSIELKERLQRRLYCTARGFSGS